MAVFLSWTSEDEAVVTRLRDRLQAAGLDVWEYREQMRTGGDISDQVIEALERAEAVVFCLSDQALASGWMADELAWARLLQAWRRDRPKEALIPVRVGPMTVVVPPQLERWGGTTVVSDVSTPDAFDNGFRGVMGALAKVYGDAMPIPVPAVLLAMTNAQYAELLDQETATGDIETLCQAAGMPFDPPVRRALLQRYGPRAEDFRPFDAARPLTDDLQLAQRRVNEERQRQQPRLRPVSLNWLSQQLARPMPEQQREPYFRQLWERKPSLLVVDSVSMLHPDVQRRHAILPEAQQGSMVLWVPPFTQHTQEWEDAIFRVSSVSGAFADAGRRWRESEIDQRNRDVAFDIATAASVRQWLRRGLFGITSDEQPQKSFVDAMQRQHGGGPEPRWFRPQQ